MAAFKKILCLDFDGVLHSYTSGWQGARVIPDDPVPGAIAFLIEAVERFDVQVYSSRSHQWGGRRAMKKWLLKHAEAFYAKQQGEELTERAQSYIDEHEHLWFMDRESARFLVKRIGFPRHKPAASVGLDDRQITFSGAWPSMDELAGFKPWNKK